MKKHVEEMLNMLTLDEKIALCSGADFWHTKPVERLEIPSVMMCDGPHGLRKQEGESDHMGIHESIKTVCYPSASALASSFDEQVLDQLGEALGRECQAEDVGMLLGPGLNMKRSPLCGRNFEYFSEDPYLAGKLAGAYIRSLQKKGVAACVKQFAANNQETMRVSGSSNLDERTLHEIYLPAFEMAVKEGKTRSVMCAYNAVNGEFCSENKMLLTDVLRKKWGFNGFVVTDWGAAKDVVKGIKAGLNLVMPGGYGTHEAALKAALESKAVTEAEVDAIAADVLQFIFDYQEQKQENTCIDREELAKLSEELAVQCAVLLKNDRRDACDEKILPLCAEKKAAFIGAFAEKPRYQGSGSSHINVTRVTSALEAAKGYDITYAKGYHAETEAIDEKLVQEAIKAAEQADAAVVFAGLPDSFESEGFDREHDQLPENQNKLIEKLSEVQKNLVVVLHGGSAMHLPWLEKVKAVLCMHLGGQQVGAATVRLLYGQDNPSGKLAETWAKKLSDTPAYLNFPGPDGIADYCERIYIGYRYYDKKEMEVQFPFGYGCSYTDFTYSSLKVEKSTLTDQDTLRVTCTVKNTGPVYGKEVVQLYIRDVQSSIDRPVRELKGFVKTALHPGEEKQIEFLLDKRSFAYYEPKIHDWYVESGDFVIEIGASSRDIRLQEMVHVESSAELPYHYTLESNVGSLQKTAKGRAIFGQLMASMPQGQEKADSGFDVLGDGAEKMQQIMLLEMPLGILESFGGMTKEQLMLMIQDLNA